MLKSILLKQIINLSNLYFKYTFWNPQKKYQSFRRLHILSAPKDKLLLSEIANEKYLISSNDMFIGQTIYAKGTFDLEKIELALKIIGEKFEPAVLIDIGANIGTICIPCIKRGYFKQAIAIEPEPFNFKLLKINVTLNDLENSIQLHNIALSDKDNEDLELGLSTENYGDHRLRKNNDQDSDRTFIKIKTQTLLNFIDEDKLEKTLIWMDTQGFEAFILKGIENILKKNPPYLAMEFDPKHFIMTNSYHLLKSTVLSSKYIQFYDLETNKKYDLTEENLDFLFETLLKNNIFTDILFIK